MGGSGGGGSAGEVSWPDYVSNQYTGLLGAGNFAGIATVNDSVISAQDANPYITATSYSGLPQALVFEKALLMFEDKLGDYEPYTLWNNIFEDAAQRYENLTGNRPYFIRAAPNSWVDIASIWVYVNDVLNASSDIANGWVDPTFDAPDDIKEDLADESEVTASTDAHRAVLNDQLSSDVLPRFEAGMRDINAVQSSAFVIGRAIIEGMGARDVAKFDADLRYKAFLQRDQLLGQAHMQIDKLNAINTDEYNKLLAGAHLQDDKLNAADVSDLDKLRAQALIQSDKINADSNKAESLVNAEMERNRTAIVYQDLDSLFKHMETNLQSWSTWAGYVIDAERIMYVMYKEESDLQINYNEKSARWDLDMVQVAGNLIASISGGTSYTPGPSPAQNALGGAFAGASIGARATGNAYGAAGGAILGGIGAYLLGR